MAADDVSGRAKLDADHARRLLAMLVSTSGRLAPVIDDWRPALSEVADEIVPTHADLFAVDIVDLDSGHPQPMLWRGTGQSASQCPTWTGLVAATIAARGPSLYPEVASIREGGPALRTICTETAEALSLSSLAVVPVRTGGLTLGTIAVGTSEPRRGLRPSDVEVYQQLAARLAMAIERVILHREARAATRQAEENARRLGLAAQAAPAIAASLNLDAVTEEAAAQIARVLNLGAAVCKVDRENVTVTSAWPTEVAEGGFTSLREAGGAARHCGHLWRSGSSTMALPLIDAGGSDVGYIAVKGQEGRAFTAEEEAVFALLVTATAAATEHARLFSQTLANETRLRAAIEASPVAIVELSADGTIVDSNPAAAVLFDWASGKPPLGSLETDILDPLLALRADLVAGDEVVDRTVTFPRNAVPPLVVQVSAALLGRRNSAAPALFMLLDVTQRLQLEREVQQGRRMESLGRLAGGVAHDFNNLLTIITGYSDLLHHQLGGSHPQIEAVDAIRSAARRATAFTDQLLTISRSRFGAGSVVEVNEVLREMMDLLPRLLTADVDLVVDCSSEEMWVGMETAQLEQILLNLVVNARNAMPDGGTLTIHTEVLSSGAASVLITVTDSGSGMDAATAEHCFEPFFSGPNQPNGTGLGLATVHGIVELAGGRISLDTAPGHGTTFSILLPQIEAQSRFAPTPSVQLGSPQVAGRTVLLVEDDAVIRSLAARILTDAGYSVHAASTAEDALDVADLLDDRIDVLVTDIVMPGSGGADLAEVLSERIAGLPIVIMSGYIDDSRRRRLAESQPHSVFLPKPFGPEQLLDALAAASAVDVDLDQGSNR